MSMEACVAAVRAGAVTPGEVMDATGLPLPSIRTWLRRAKQRGLLARSGYGHYEARKGLRTEQPPSSPEPACEYTWHRAAWFKNDTRLLCLTCLTDEPVRCSRCPLDASMLLDGMPVCYECGGQVRRREYSYIAYGTSGKFWPVTPP